MIYTVMAIENVKFLNMMDMEMTEEKTLERIKCGDAESAEKEALRLVDKYEAMDGDYEVIVHYLHEDSPCYLNPVGGHSPVGESWM